MSRLKQILQDEPTAIGTLIASVAPALVLIGVLRIDETQLSALVVAVNALVGFAIRLVVSPLSRTGAGDARAGGARPAGGAPA